MKHILKHLLRLLCLAILFPLGGSPVKAQAHDSDPIDIPASSPNGVSVNQMVYIANAVDHLQANKTPESAALLFYILKAYQDNPNLQPGIALRLLLTARDKYDKRYRSTVVQANYKFHMQPFDILSNMLAILALMPNNSVSFQCNLESLNYVTHAGNHLSDGNDWLETGQGDARLRASGGYEDYLQTQLSGVYLLAQNNSNVAQLVDNFFGGAFNASVYDSGLTILSNNPALRDSQNFHPLVNMIGANGAIHTTFLQARLMIEGFFDRMSTAAQNSITALGSMTNLQKNYAASFQDPNTLQQMQALVNDNSATNAPLLQSADAFAAVGWQTLAVSPSYKAYKQTTACLRTAAKAAAFAGDTIEAVGEGMKVPPNVAGAVGKGFKATGNGLDMVANALDVDAAFGAFGDSPESLTLKGVNKIGESLDALQTQMNKRLDVIDHNILQLYTQMNSQFNNITNLLVNGFNQVNTAVLNMQSQLLNIQSKIDRLTQTIDVFAQQAGRHDLVQSLQTIDLYVRNPPNANCDTSLTFYNTTYVPNYITCLGFATFHAVTDLGEVGLPLANRQYDSFSVENELNSNPELNINYVLQYANVHFYAKQFTQEDALFAPIQPLPTGVANPRSWEMSVLGMMRLASTFPNCYQASTLNDTQKSGQGFFAAYNRGNAIQSVVAQTTVEPSNNGLGFQKSQLFPNLILNHNLKAKALSDAILAVENDYLNTHPNAPAQDIVAAVKFQWNTTNPSANGQLLQNYAKAFSGSKHLLDAFINFGLGRTLEASDGLSSLLYSPQQLPDGNSVLTMYQTWLDTFNTGKDPGPNPRLVFYNPSSGSLGTQQVRSKILNAFLNGADDPMTHLHTDGILDRIVKDANNTGLPLGEPLPAVDAMLNRFAFFRRASVSGRVRPQPGSAFIPGQPVTLTFAGSRDTFVIPVMLDANGNFTVWLPPDIYLMGAKADRFLQKKFDTVLDTGLGNISFITPNPNNPTHIDLLLLTGDVTGHNLVNGTDLILLRNALGSTPNSLNWNELADLNGDNIVDNKDLTILRTNWGKKGDHVP